MEQAIYIVFGHSGEWEGESTWTVAAYFDRDMACEHAGLAEEAARKAVEQWRSNYGHLKDSEHDDEVKLHYDQLEAPRNPYDLHMQAVDSHIHYTVETAALRTSLPTEQAKEQRPT